MLARFRVFVVVIAVAFAALSATPTFAAKGHGGGTTTGTSSLSLVLVNSTDGVPHWGQQVTFNVATSATTEPHVSLDCSQNGTVVYAAETGYYASYPWPWTQIMNLSSQSWTGGAADCIATLYYFSGTKAVNLATLSFHVYA